MERETIVVKRCRWLDLGLNRDTERGDLRVVESSKHLPFENRRVYFIFPGSKTGEADFTRGHHAHRVIEQAMVALRGHCLLELDDGERRQSVRLASPDHCLYTGPLLWHSLSHFSPECLLCVFASHPYDEADYIRDHREFLKTLA